MAATQDGKSPGHDHVARREPLIPTIRVTPQERNRLILVGLAAALLFWLLSVSVDALGPFIIALVLAYVMLPLVELLHRRMPRAIAILLVYLFFIGIVVGIVWWLVPLLGNQVRQLADQVPAYLSRAQEWGASLTAWYNSLPLPAEVRQSIETSIKNSAGSIGSALQQGIVGSFSLISRTMGFIIGFVIIPFWLFYVLKDKERGIEAFNNMMPRAWRADIWRIVRIINGILSSYIRGQLLLGLVVGVATTAGMLLVGAPYAVILGIISGMTEIVPVVGPILGAVPGVALASFSAESWVLVVKVLLVYIVVQQLENNLLVPKIQGDSVKMHPALIMIALVVGSQVGGLVGLIAAVPVAAIMRDVYLYLYKRFTEDFTPRDAEASVPSRRGEESAPEKIRSARELELEKTQPGINSEDELIADIDEAASSTGAARSKST